MTNWITDYHLRARRRIARQRLLRELAWCAILGAGTMLALYACWLLGQSW